jgi:hypothetical protein
MKGKSQIEEPGEKDWEKKENEQGMESSFRILNYEF